MSGNHAWRRTSDAGRRTSDGEKSKNNISTPQGGGHNNNPKRVYLFLYLLTNKILFLTQLIILFNLPSKYLNDWWFNVHSKIHNPKSAYLFLYLFTNKILFKKKLFILLFYYIIFRICKLFSVIHFLYTYICGPYICNLNMWHNLSSDSPLCYM